MKNDNDLRINELLYSKRIIEIWEPLWLDKLKKIRKKLIKFDRMSDKPIFLHISGENDAKSETWVLYDLISVLRSEVYTVGAGGLEGFNGLLFLAGYKKIVYPNMWLSPWWPVHPDIEESGNMDWNKNGILQIELTSLDEQIIKTYANLLCMSISEYKELCFSSEALLVSDLVEKKLIDEIIYPKNSNWYTDLIN